MAYNDDFLSNMVSRDQPYSQRILEISLPHCFLPQNDRKCMGREPSLLLARSFGQRVSSNVALRSLRHPVPCVTSSQRDCVFGQNHGSGGG
ncbi:hypothetical protein AVEN_171119-1 [Araneus ventricosus]|uniref:Uncharacterized protein n=1 Tax=Araneus ventricosus TaxID=182803 RepID=A0A4Y2MDT7_ARAVE|nr:hypothetical protein AVEN_171119-1 [Araneus ventricosus]